MRRLVLAGLLVVALVVGLAGPAASARSTPRDTAHFNVVAPWGTPKQRWKLVRNVDAAISNVPARSKKHPSPTIYIATFMFDSKRTLRRLVAACRRGVSVRVVLDDDVTNRKANRLRSALNGDNLRDRNRNGVADKLPARGPCGTKLTKGAKKKAIKAAKTQKAKARKRKRAGRKPAPMSLGTRWGRDRSYVKTCHGACRGPGWNMHSKFYVFSATGPYRHVVKLSSSNLNRGGALKGWNDMYTIRGQSKLYNVFRRMHRRMTREPKGGPRLVEVSAGKYIVRFYPARKAGPRTDPVMRDLSKVKCRTPLGRYNRTKVFVSMFYWKGGRGEYIAKRLIKLGRKGCKVQVVMGAPSKKVAGMLRRASRRKVINAYDSRWDFNADGVVDNRTHAKFVLVKGNYNGRKRTYRVMTGSGNWVRGSLVGGDEVSLNIAGKRPYKQYVKAWDRIRNRSRIMGRW